MSERSFEGYRYQEPLDAGFYGQTYRARGPSGEEACLLEVGDGFSAHQEFATILLARGKLLASFDHPHVVGTRAVGRAPDGRLLVVTDAVQGRVALEELLGSTTDTGMQPLPRPVAAAVMEAVVEALAAAHKRSVVHGALHPRSVVIDQAGTVKLDDFAMARALTSWSGRDSAGAFVQAFAGFLAPEMAQGAKPDASTDVYAAGALFLAAVTGRTAAASFDPGALSPAVAGVIARALDTNRLHRYANARRFRDDLRAAWEEDGWQRATRDELAAFLVQRQRPSRAEDELERETETVLSLLGDVLTPPPAAPELDAAMESMLAEMDERPGSASPEDATAKMPAQEATVPVPRDQEPAPGRVEANTPAPARPAARASSEAAALAALADLDHPGAGDGDGDATVPTPTGPPASRDSSDAALAALADLDHPGAGDGDTAPLETIARPARTRAGSEVTDVLGLEDLEEVQNIDETTRPEEPAAAPSPAAAAPAERAIESPPPAASIHERATERLGMMPSPGAASAAAPAGSPPRAGMQIPDPGGSAPARRRRLGPAVWLAIIAVAGAMLVWLVRQQGALRTELEERAEQREAEQREQLRAYMASQPKSGVVTIDSDPPGAAVWMLLGRTPLDTSKLSASMVHELRLELEGYQPRDIRVAAEHWSGEGEALRAEITGRLDPGTPAAPLPAYPPEPPPEARRDLPAGQGAIHVESEPSGAQVWLLVGITPSVDVTAVAGDDYEFKVRKDGYLPGVVVVRSADWKSGERQVTRSITLQRRGRRRRR